MRLEEYLLQQKSAILTKWFDAMLETYPPETARLLKREKNQFANPVGHTLQYGLKGLFEEFLQEFRPEKISAFLDDIIRIRAVQEFSPSQAIAFVYLLKRIVREVVQGQIRENRISADDLMTFELKLDELTRMAFDIYTHCRENLYEVRIKEVKSRSHRLLQRANLIAEIPEQDKESEEPTH